MDWIEKYASWIQAAFSGIGVVILCGILKFFFGKRKSDAAVQQRAGNNAVNINAGRDVHYAASRKN